MKTHLIAFLIFLLTYNLATAEDWTTYSVDRSEIKATDGQFGPNGQFFVLFSEVTTFTETTRSIRLSRLDGTTFIGETIDSFPDALDPGRFIQLVGDDQSVWAFWEGLNSSNNPTLKATKVYPRDGAFIIEDLGIDNGQSSYDACLGSDGLPRLAAANFREITLLRRQASGTWESKEVSSIELGSRYREIDLACQNNTLSLFLTLNSPTPDTPPPSFDSQFIYREASEPINWNNLSFGTNVTLETATFPFDQAVAGFIESQWISEDTLAVAFSNLKENSAQLSTRVAGIWSSRNYFDKGPGLGLVFGVDLASDSEQNIHLTRTDSVNRIHHLIWDGTSFSPDNIVTDVTSFSPDLEVDDRGVPYIFSKSTDNITLRASTPTDTTDEDGDGVIFLLEDAFRMNPTVADRENLPMMDFETISGERFFTLNFLSQSGGTGNNPYITSDFEYHTEISNDLSNWSVMPSDILLRNRFSILGRGAVHTYRSAEPVNSKEFMRVRVIRR